MGCSHSVAALPPPSAAVSASGRSGLVDGIIIDPSHAGEIQSECHGRSIHFTTLLEAFQYCDPKGMGVASDEKRVSRVQRKFKKEYGGACKAIILVTAEGGGRINFPAFVEWAQSNGVALPVGLPTPTSGFPYPSTWKGSKNDRSWNRRFVVEDAELLDELQQLLNISYKRIWTRDRKRTGINRVPDEYRLESALQSENYKDWCAYYAKRFHLLDQCRSRPGFFPLSTSSSDTRLVKRHHLERGCNEWLLFHGTTQSAAKAICASDFTMDLAGSATGTLYGKGTYFAESITKADEYSTEDCDGLCCVLLCRVAGGRVLLNAEDSPDGEQLQQCILSGAADSILGSRDVAKNTFREFVTFDVDQVYVEYVLFYRRVYNSRHESDAPVRRSSGTKVVEFDGFGVVGLEPIGEPATVRSPPACIIPDDVFVPGHIATEASCAPSGPAEMRCKAFEGEAVGSSDEACYLMRSGDSASSTKTQSHWTMGHMKLM